MTIYLFTLGVNWDTGDVSVISGSNETLIPPNQFYISGKQPEDLVKDLFENLTNLKYSWTKAKLFSARYINGELCLTYCNVIPITTTLSNSWTWISSTKIPDEFQEDLKEMIRQI